LSSIRFIIPFALALLVAACSQQEGQVCEAYDPTPNTPGDDSNRGDCAVGLTCCNASSGRGLCTPVGECVAVVNDAGPGPDGGQDEDAGPLLDGDVPDGGGDDAGAEDAGAEDAGAGDAGADDGGPSDGGPGDGGPGDGGPSDGGPGDGGPGDAG